MYIYIYKKRDMYRCMYIYTHIYIYIYIYKRGTPRCPPPSAFRGERVVHLGAPHFCFLERKGGAPRCSPLLLWAEGGCT